MIKVCAPKDCFALVRQDASQYIISYGYSAEQGKSLATWEEVYVPFKEKWKISFKDIRQAILADIDAQTDERILNGYEFTPDGADTPIVVWLSRENQTNFSEAQRLAIRFYKGGVAYIQQCLQQGWARKDAIDWAPYRALFPDEQPSTPDDEPPTPDNSQAITPDGQN